MTNLPPAGWYPTPENPNTQRYWDGQQWTEHTYDPYAATVAAETVQPETVPAETVVLPETAQPETPVQLETVAQPEVAEADTTVLPETVQTASTVQPDASQAETTVLPETSQPATTQFQNPQDYVHAQAWPTAQPEQPAAQPYYSGYPAAGAGYPPNGAMGYSPNYAGGQPPRKSKAPLIISLIVVGVLVLGVGGYFLWSNLFNQNQPPVALPTPTETTPSEEPTDEPTEEPTDEPSDEPTDPPMNDYLFVWPVSGPTDVAMLDPGLNWVTSVYGVDSEWEEFGNAWEYVSYEENWLTMQSSVNSCTLIHTSGSPNAAGLVFTDPYDDTTSSYEFALQLLPHGPTLDEYFIYSYWHSGVGQNSPGAASTDIFAIDWTNPETGYFGYVLARNFGHLDWAHFSYIECQTIEEAETAHYNFMDFELVVEAE